MKILNLTTAHQDYLSDSILIGLKQLPALQIYDYQINNSKDI